MQSNLCCSTSCSVVPASPYRATPNPVPPNQACSANPIHSQPDHAPPRLHRFASLCYTTTCPTCITCPYRTMSRPTMPAIPYRAYRNHAGPCPAEEHQFFLITFLIALKTGASSFNLLYLDSKDFISLYASANNLFLKFLSAITVQTSMYPS